MKPPRKSNVELAEAKGLPLFRVGDMAEVGAKLVEVLTGDGEPLAGDVGSLWRYDRATRCWEELPPELLTNTVRDFSGAKILKGVTEEGREITSTLKINASEAAIKFALAAPSAWQRGRGYFEAAPQGVAFRDCFVRIEGGKLKREPLGPDHRVRWTLPCGWSAELAAKIEGSEWMRYLRVTLGEACGEKGRALQEFIGACLLGLVKDHQRALMLVGSGSNGKSVFMEVIEALFPATARATIPPQELVSEYNRADLEGKAINVVRELPEAELLDTTKLKALITCEPIRGRKIYGHPFVFTPRCGQLYSANTLPTVRDRSHGFWRRWLVVSFDQEFAAAADLPSRPGAALADPTLAPRIIKDEIGIVAAWALEGAARLLKQGGYSRLEASAEAIQEWREDTDQLAAYVASRLEVDKLDKKGPRGYAWTTVEELHHDYTRWCNPTQGVHRVREPLTQMIFGRQLKALVRCEKINIGDLRGVKRYRAAITSEPHYEVVP
jgi:P4 family phage/plasmid primase-like protien